MHGNVKTVYPPQTTFAGGIMKTVYPPQTKFAGGIITHLRPNGGYIELPKIKTGLSVVYIFRGYTL